MLPPFSVRVLPSGDIVPNVKGAVSNPNIKAGIATDASSASDTAVASTDVTTIGAPPPAIRAGENGRIEGIDGMLSQISGALAREFVPVIKSEVLPQIQQDREMQRTIGAAAGAAIADKLKPYVIALTGGVLVIAGIKIYKLATRGSK